MNFQLKPLYLSIFLLLGTLGTIASANNIVGGVPKQTNASKTDGKAANKSANDKDGKAGDKVISTKDKPVAPPEMSGNAAAAAEFLKTGRPANLSSLQMPNNKNWESQGRFGENRGSRPHRGVDINNALGTPLKPLDSGEIVTNASQLTKDGGGHYVSVRRDNNGKGGTTDGFRYLHMQYKSGFAPGSKVSRNDVIGYEGGTGAGGIHVHMDYGVPFERVRNAWIDGSGKILAVRLGQGNTKNDQRAKNMSITGLYNTDPTPYFDKDVLFTGLALGPGYVKYYGTSWRTQFNTLYGTNLPIDPKAKKPTAQLPATYLNQLKNTYANTQGLTPEELAAAQRTLAEGAMVADSAGYDVSGQYVSQRVLASFMLVDDGKDFATMPGLMDTGDITQKSPKELILQIGNKRYGNPQWEQDMTGLNSKGLMTEYLMMNAQENFIKQQSAEVRSRIENMLAVSNLAQLEEYKKKIEALQVTAEADKVPSMIDLKLEASGDEWVDTGYWGNCEPTAAVAGGGSAGGAAEAPATSFGKETMKFGNVSVTVDHGKDGKGEYYDVRTEGDKPGTYKTTRYYRQKSAPANALKPVPAGVGTKAGMVMHEMAIGPLERMVAAAKKDGVRLTVMSAHRSVARQRELITGRLNGKGKNYRTPENVFASGSIPGTSEHHTGLALDFCDVYSHKFKPGGECYEQGKWLRKNAATYGFTQSYPTGNAQHVMPEEWHFAYTGTPEARELLKPIGAPGSSSGGATTGSTATSAARPAGGGAATGAAAGSGKAYYIGDSIAAGGANQGGTTLTTTEAAWTAKGAGGKGTQKGIPGQAVVGSNPAGVLLMVQNHASKLKGQNVVLSSGASNSGGLTNNRRLSKTELDTIEKQIQTLQNAGASVTLMGVANNFIHGADIGRNVNQQLDALAKKYKISFAGGFTATDGLHGQYNIAKTVKSAGAIGEGGGAPSGEAAGGNYGYCAPNDTTGADASAGQGTPATRAAKAAQHATRNWQGSRRNGKCATFVRQDLQAGGYSFTPQPSAYMYHSEGILKQIGFTRLNADLTTFKPQAGDIVVWDRRPGKPHGHIQIYDGTRWVSDFRQQTPYPWAGVRTGYTIYRDLSRAGNSK
ncbi:D-alanyl-D-alanine carboxypeptidase family protein [Moraxella sp. ZJ142]|uniref:D-alanyl-D-alanine carboxypeptidase family protein n=1 Tax=Moraxella marmotae TaxID=3344520 RepID=UPI0035D51577